MKPLIVILATSATLITAGCATQHKTAMLLDSSYADDKQVTVLRKNVPVRITESMKNFEENPNITQADIDAGKRIESKEVRYVNKGDKIRISEEPPPTSK